MSNFGVYATGIDLQVVPAGTDVASFRASARALAGASGSSWDLLHDVRPTGDPRRHFHLRSVGATTFPVVLTHHALCYPDYLENFFTPLLLAGSQSYDALVCTSRSARAAVVNLFELCGEGLAAVSGRAAPTYKGQLPIIPLGVDTNLYRPRDVADARYQLGVSPNAFVLLWLGRLSAATKADLTPLVRAYWLLRERNPGRETLLALVGTDPEGFGQVLEACAAAHGLGPEVRVVRTTPHTPVHAWYSIADVFVSPVDNLQESFGVAVIEAMASGVPQVVSDWDGQRDTVVDGVTGFRVRTYWAACDDAAVEHWAVLGDPGTPAALLAQTVACDMGELVECLERLLRSPALRAEMGAASRARALAEYAWPTVVSRHVECWRALVDEARCITSPPPGPVRVLPAYFNAFAGHASHVLTGRSVLRLREDPEPPRHGSVSASGAVTAPALTTGPAAAEVERVLVAVAEAGEEVSIDALTTRLEPEGWSGSEVLRVVLWAVKHTLLDVRRP